MTASERLRGLAGDISDVDLIRRVDEQHRRGATLMDALPEIIALVAAVEVGVGEDLSECRMCGRHYAKGHFPDCVLVALDAKLTADGNDKKERN